MTARKKILIVEDDRIIVLDLTKKLSKIGFDIAGTADTGMEAVKKAEKLKPDLILMDIGLSGEMDGIEAAAEIKKKYSVPVVFLTAGDDDATIQRALEIEPDGYIKKPISEAILKTTIITALRWHGLDMLSFTVKEDLRTHQVELGMQNEELRRLHENLATSQKLYFDYFDLAPVGYFSLSEKGLIIEANLFIASLLNVTRDLLKNKPFSRYILPEDINIYHMFKKQLFSSVTQQSCELRMAQAGRDPIWVRIESSAVEMAGGKKVCRVVLSDITWRKESERRQMLTAEILEILNNPVTLSGSIKNILAAIKRVTGSDAAGIRIRSGDDFPYFVQDGFSSDFLHSENTLLSRNSNGGICRDEKGNVSLECTCGLVISGKTDPGNPLFTEAGSAWTNNSLTFLEIPAGADPRLNPRNRCVHDGYQSVAFIPIRSNNEIVGLLQLNDRRKDRFTLDAIKFFEGLCASIGIALMRKQSVEALRASGDKFTTIVNSINDAIYVIDLSDNGIPGKFIEVNDAACKMLGYSREEFFALSPRDINSLESRKSIQKEVDSLFSKGVLLLESTHVAKDGRNIPVEINAHVVNIMGGKKIVSIVRDITMRKHAEIELRESEERFRTLIEMSPQGINVHRDGKFIYFNPAAMTMLGATPEKNLVGKPILDLIHPDFHQFVQKRVKKITDGDARLVPEEGMKFLRLDGTVMDVEAKGISVTYDGLSSVCVFWHDITERKLAEEKLREAYHFNRQVISGAQEGIIVYGPDLRYQVWNPYMEQLTGYPGGEVLGKHPMELFPFLNEAGVMDRLKNVLSGKPVESVEFPFHFEGTEKSGWAIDTSTPLFNADGKITGVIGMIHDITDRKKTEEEIINISNIPRENPNPIIRINNERIILYANPSGIQLLETMGCRVGGTSPVEWDAYMDQAIASRSSLKIELEYSRSFLEINVVPISEKKYLNLYFSDVTERKRAETALIKGEEELRLILDSTGEAIYGIDMEGKCSFYNPAFLRLLGYTNPEDLIGENMHLKIHYKHLNGSPYPVEDCHIFQAFKQGKGCNVNNEVFWRADGTCFPVDYYSHPQLRDGTVVGAVVTFVDITARKQAEEKILREYNIHATLTSLYEPMMKSNISMEEISKLIHYWAKYLTRSEYCFVSAIDRVTGENVCYAISELIKGECGIQGENGRIVFPGNKNDMNSSLFGHSLNSGVSFYTNDITSHPDSRGAPAGHVPLIAFLSVPFIVDKELAGQIALANPSTPYTDNDLDVIKRLAEFYAIAIKRKRDEEDLHASDKRFRKVVENIDEYIYTVDYESGNPVVFYHSPQSVKVTGYGQEEFIANPGLWFSMIHEDDRKAVKDYLAGIRAGQLLPAIGHRIIHKNGSVHWVQNSCTMEIDEKGSLIRTFGFIIDITNQKLFEKELRDAKDTAEKANRSKTEFLTNMSHELRTPLNAILGFSQVLGMESHGNVNEEQRKHISYIKEGGEHLLYMVNDLLDLAKIEAGKFELDKKPFDIGKMLILFPELLKSIAIKNNIELQIDIHNDIGLLNADEIRVKQVMYNLMSNAIKFTAPGKKVGLEARGEGDTVIITVWDEGMGIGQNEMKRIFQPFEQGSHGKKVIQGTGLGLSITRQLMDLQHGKLSVTSEPGKGSSFTVTFPGRLPMTEGFSTISRTEPGYMASALNKYQGNILVVEDNFINQELMKAIFKSFGLEIRLADSGEDAVELAASEEFDLILMDVNLPGMDGVETMKRIRLSDGRHTPIVALTAHSMIGDVKKFISEGMDDVLNKPVEMIKLESIVKKYLPYGNTITETIKKPAPGDSDKYTIASAADSFNIPVERFKSIIETFFSNKMDDYLSNIGEAIAKKDYQSIQSATHKLRGAVANLRFISCAEILKEMEESGGKMIDADYTGLLEKLKQELFRLKAELIS